MKIGEIRELILFGGGSLLIEIAKESTKNGLKTHVFAVKRHLDEVIDEKNRSTMREMLDQGKIPYFQVKDINTSTELRALVSGNTLGIGLGEVYTFNKETIALFKGKLFDFMVINLPQYRGGAHFTWQILRGDKTGCWNIQVINEEMVPAVFDSGEILKRREYKIPDEASIPQDYFDLSEKEGLILFIEFIKEIKDGKDFELKGLDEGNSLYLPRLNTLKHGYVDWSWELKEIERFICAFDDPYAGASTFINGKKVFIKNCRHEMDGEAFHPFISGIVYKKNADTLFVAIKDGTLAIKRVLDESGRSLLSEIRVGQRFFTPAKYIEEAMLFNADYDSEGLVKC